MNPEQKPIKDIESPGVPDRLEPINHLRTMGLPLALAIAIGAALLLTAVSIGLYLSSNLSRIDLSKPKYEDIREDVLPNGNNETLDTTSPITKDSLNAAIDELNKRRQDLQKLGGFDTQVLDDASIGLSTELTQ